uniref:Uncharacterized protein n=1 Tax=Cyanoderma ruficeps TaxID=181631 RepID=A0A8C3P3F9_9PASS
HTNPLKHKKIRFMSQEPLAPRRRTRLPAPSSCLFQAGLSPPRPRPRRQERASQVPPLRAA